MPAKKILKNKTEEYSDFNKFKDVDSSFHEMINKILYLKIPKIDFIHQFPIYIGHVNLARYLFFYDLYKKIYQLAGHIADVGTWKGSSFLFMAKLIKLFEPYSHTQVHGFDWFKGMKPGKNDDAKQVGRYDGNYEMLLKLIDLQKLNDTAILHKLDLIKKLEDFFSKNRHLRFKMIFIDCGIERVLEESLRFFWPRLVRGGILIMDHYCCECSPGESKILEKYIGKNYIKHLQFTRQPTAFVIKEK